MRREYNQKLAEKGAGKQFHSLKGIEVEYVRELLDWVNPQLEKNGQPALKGHTPEWLAARIEDRERPAATVGFQEYAVVGHSYIAVQCFPDSDIPVYMPARVEGSSGGYGSSFLNQIGVVLSLRAFLLISGCRRFEGAMG